MRASLPDDISVMRRTAVSSAGTVPVLPEDTAKYGDRSRRHSVVFDRYQMRIDALSWTFASEAPFLQVARRFNIMGGPATCLVIGQQLGGTGH